MKLGEIIREYRLRNKMSMGDFARVAGISKPYISMLEADKNSNGGKPIAPSIETLQKTARVVGISLDELLRKLGDEKIDLRAPAFSADETKLVDDYRTLNDEGQNALLLMLNSLKMSHPKKKNSTVVQRNSGGTNFIVTGGSNNYGIVTS